MDGRSVGRYEIVRPIGHGGMATVYLARQTDLERDVALKELNVVDGSDPRAARRFLREARLAGSLSHPNIVTVHDFFQYDGKPYIAMEYLPLGSLRPYVGRLSLAQIGGVIDGILAGLAYAEERRVVHRDLKPENVMVTGEGRVKIADFGIAKATSTVQEPSMNITRTGATLGTPNYIAPEQAMAKELGPATDLYSLGVMAFEFLVGRLPFYDTEEPIAIAMRHVNEEIPPVRTLRPDVDPVLSAWVERLLIKDPSRRTRSAAQASDELDEILIDQIGPRWRRAALLPDRPGAPAVAAVAAAAPASVSLPQLPVSRGVYETMAPSTQRLPLESSVELRTERAERPHPTVARNIVVAVLALIAIVALLAGFLGGGNGGTPTGAPSQGVPASTPTTRDAAPTGAATESGGTTPSGAAPPGQAPPATGTTPPGNTQQPAATDSGTDSGDEPEDELSDDPSDDAGENGAEP